MTYWADDANVMESSEFQLSCQQMAEELGRDLTDEEVNDIASGFAF